MVPLKLSSRQDGKTVFFFFLIIAISLSNVTALPTLTFTEKIAAIKSIFNKKSFTNSVLLEGSSA